MNRISAILATLISLSAFAQKKIIDHTVYNDWKSLKSSQISNDGKFISYEINPHKGDGYLFIYNTETKALDSIHRGKGARFSGESGYLAFRIKPGYDTLRNCELNKVNKKKWPKDSLGIYLLEKDSLLKMPKLKSFEMNDESEWMTIFFDHNKCSTEKKKKKRGFCKKKKGEMEYDSDGHVLKLFNPAVEEKIEFKDVRSSEFSKNGSYVAFTTHKKEECDSVHMSIFNTVDLTTWCSPGKFTDLQKFVFDDQENKLAYLASKDTAKVKTYALNLLDISSKSNAILADTTSSFLPIEDAVSIHFAPKFTKKGDLLYFGVAERPEQEEKDTLLPSEKVKLDLWHYQDKRLQPQQLLEKKRDERRTDLYVYHLNMGKAVQLSNDTLRVRSIRDLSGKYLTGVCNEAYQHTYNWEAHRRSDYYRVAIETGEVELLNRGAKFKTELSPSGKYYTYYDGTKGAYYVVDIEGRNTQCMTGDAEDAIWTYDINGMPMEAYPNRIIGWDKDESTVYIQSRYDVWAYTLNTQELVSLSNGEGQEGRIKIQAREWAWDSVYVDFDNMYLYGFDEKTKGDHFYTLEEHGDHVDLTEMAYFDAKVSGLQRSKNKKQYTLRKMTFQDYPELYVYNGDMTKLEQITETNPQQDEYNWGTVELVNWKSYEGIELEGLLYKPEDFDSTKSYPLMVYFYELYSDRLHQHYMPKPTASIIYATEYASAGYVVLMPDIRYIPGHPGKSAYDCIMSGTDHVLELLPNVDSTRMALQGQSWGGYQTAQLITMTTRYKAAMAGAPVSNMFSAYGGIRWGSGLNRQFQYERTQSRIGYTIWEKPELYVENSPLFHLPNVETPLMIMHNDNDGAVPWYQGIELFTGLKRLGKTAWLLNYNGDKHNLMKNANRMDLSIRMRQFFDHYLLNKEAPEWLTDGIPAIMKGKDLRY